MIPTHRNIVYRYPSNAKSGYKTVVDIFNYIFEKYNYNFVKSPLFFHNSSQNLSITKELYTSSIELVILPLAVDLHNSVQCNNIKSYIPQIIYTMWECDKLPQYNVELLNKFDLIVVPSKWNKQIFIESGVKVPIEVLPLFCNTIFKPEINQKDEVFVFGTGNNDPRKRLTDIIYCFCKAFHPSIKDVQLKVKIAPSENIGSYVDERISIIDKHYKLPELKDWYNSLDVFVSIAYGEGWGLMQHESMACGIPVMTPHFGGITEFIPESLSIPLKYKLSLAQNHYKNSYGFWADVDLEHTIQQMKYCYENKEKLKNIGIQSHHHINNNFNEQKFISIFNSIITNF